jgi:hypothetical protein
MPEIVNTCAGIAVTHLGVGGFSMLRSKREQEIVGIFEEGPEAYEE